MSAIIENWWRFLFWNIISTWSSQYLYEILRSKFILWNCKFSNNSQKPYLPNVLLQCMAPRFAFVHYASSSSARITTPLQYHFHHNHYSYHILRYHLLLASCQPAGSQSSASVIITTVLVVSTKWSFVSGVLNIKGPPFPAWLPLCHLWYIL